MFKTTLKLNFSSLTQSYSEIQIGKEHDQDSTTKNDDFGECRIPKLATECVSME